MLVSVMNSITVVVKLQLEYGRSLSSLRRSRFNELLSQIRAYLQGCAQVGECRILAVDCGG